MSQKIVIALGGNALGSNPQEQLDKLRHAAAVIADLAEEGNELLITHGNGPQVGMINHAMEQAAKQDADIPYMPFPECGAMSQGYIGYHLQQSLQNEFHRRSLRRNCVSLVTQVGVDEEDPAFQDFTKPVGCFYSREEAEKISRETGYVFREDSGRGWRRVVPSPKPAEIIELDAIEQLLKAHCIVIAGGGGGIPVIRHENSLKGVASVIDKDHTSSLLARQLHADLLMILTTVDRVCLNYGTDSQQELSEMSLSDAGRYLSQGQFGTGSMEPKIEACMDFVQAGGRAVITSMDRASEALHHQNGTWITAQRLH